MNPERTVLGNNLRVANHLELHLYISGCRGHRERVHSDQVLGVARAGPAAVVQETVGGGAVYTTQGHLIPVTSSLGSVQERVSVKATETWR